MADFVSVMKDVKRMCDKSLCHYNCPIKQAAGTQTCFGFMKDHPEEAGVILKVWAAKHPVHNYGTYLEYLEEVLPNAKILKAKGYCPRKELFCEDCDELPCAKRECSCVQCLSEPILEETALRLGIEPEETEVRVL